MRGGLRLDNAVGMLNKDTGKAETLVPDLKFVFSFPLDAWAYAAFSSTQFDSVVQPAQRPEILRTITALRKPELARAQLLPPLASPG
eukprot:1161496-Pelagomonas_calceolata.AAC.3